MTITEEVSVMSDGQQTHELRLSKCESPAFRCGSILKCSAVMRSNSAPFDEIKEIRISILTGGDQWHVLVSLRKSTKPFFQLDEEDKRTMDCLTSEIESRAASHEIDTNRLSDRRDLFGSARPVNGFLSITYRKEHSVKHLLCDLFMIAQTQASDSQYRTYDHCFFCSGLCGLLSSLSRSLIKSERCVVD